MLANRSQRLSKNKRIKTTHNMRCSSVICMFCWNDMSTSGACVGRKQRVQRGARGSLGKASDGMPAPPQLSSPVFMHILQTTRHSTLEPPREQMRHARSTAWGVSVLVWYVLAPASGRGATRQSVRRRLFLAPRWSERAALRHRLALCSVRDRDLPADRRVGSHGPEGRREQLVASGQGEGRLTENLQRIWYLRS